MDNQQFYIAVAIWSQVISSVLFLGVMVWLWVRFIQPAVLAAQDNSNKLIAEAERHRDEAKATLEMLGGEIDGATHDAGLIKARAAAQAQREYDESVAEATESGERALQNAGGELDRARASARDQLRVELLDRALAQARVEAARRLDERTNAVLVDRFIADLGSKRG
jgi:F0F1-type ATP synthase membrane subunit b/b'